MQKKANSIIVQNHLIVLQDSLIEFASVSWGKSLLVEITVPIIYNILMQKNLLILLFSVFYPLLGYTGVSVQPAPPPITTQSYTPLDCPTSIDSLDEYRQRFVSNNFTGEMGYNLFLDGTSKRQLQTCITSLNEQFPENSDEIEACLNNLTQLLSRSAANSSQVNAVYAETEQRNPEMLTPPSWMYRGGLLASKRGLLDVLNNPNSTSADIQTAVRRAQEVNPGIRVVSFTSAHLGFQGGRALGRYAVFVPGERYDQWMFLARYPTAENQNQGISLVTVEKKDAQGRTLTPPRSYFRDFIVNNFGPDRRIRSVQAQPNQQACTQCHTNGPIPIFPSRGETAFQVTYQNGETFDQTISSLNARMGSYGLTSTPGFDARASQVGFGPVNLPTRTDSFIQDCANTNLSQQEITRVKSAMNCSSCHNGATRAALTYPFGRIPRNDFFTTSIINGHMPPGSDLSQKEREVVARCLKQEFYGSQNGFSGNDGVFMRHLTEGSCPNPVTTVNSDRSIERIVPTSTPSTPAGASSATQD